MFALFDEVAAQLKRDKTDSYRAFVLQTTRPRSSRTAKKSRKKALEAMEQDIDDSHPQKRPDSDGDGMENK